MPVNSKKLQRVIAKAKKVDYVKSVRNRRIITGVSAAILASGAIGGTVYGFWYLSQKSTKPALVAFDSNTNDQILSDTPYCGSVAVDGSPSIGCYAGQVRLTSLYGSLITKDRLSQIATWFKTNINRGPEGAVISNVKFSPGVDSTVGVILGYRTESKDDSAILMSPDAQDWIQNMARASLDEQAVAKYETSVTKAASDFSKLLENIFTNNTADHTVPRDSTGKVDTSTPVGKALNNLLISTSSLANWNKDSSKTNFLQTIYKVLFRTAYNTPANTASTTSPVTYDLNSTDDYAAIYDRTLVSTLINATDPSFKKADGTTLSSYYQGQGVDFKSDVLGSLSKLDDLHATLMQGNGSTAGTASVSGTNSALSKSAFVTAGKALQDYIKAVPKVDADDSATLAKPLLDALFQDPTLAKTAFVSYSDAVSTLRTRGSNRDVAPGVSSLQPLLFSNYNSLARRFISSAKVNISATQADVGRDTVSYNVNNPDVLAYAPTAEDLGTSIVSGAWFNDNDFYKNFSDGLFKRLFSDMAYTLSHEYGHHYTIWNTQNGELEDLTNVFSESMISSTMNRSAWNALLEAETNGGNLDNWSTQGTNSQVNTFALKNLIMASDASNATYTNVLLAYDKTNTLPKFKNKSNTHNLLAVPTYENYQLWVTTKGGIGTLGTDFEYYDYVRILVDLINKAYFTNVTSDDETTLTNGKYISKAPVDYNAYVNALYPSDSAEKTRISGLVTSLFSLLAAEKSKSAATPRTLNDVGKLATQITSQIAYDAANNATSPTPSAKLPGIVKTINTTDTPDVTAAHPLATQLSAFSEQRSKNPSFKFGDPYLFAQATSLGFGQGGSSVYNYAFSDYVLQYTENLTRLWQVLTLPVDERPDSQRNGDAYITKNDVEEDNSYLRSLGIYLYDETTGDLTETGKRVLDFYRSMAGLVVDKTTHTVVDAQQLHQFNILRNNNLAEASGWIKKEDAQKVTALKFTDRLTGSISLSKIYINNVGSNHYYTQLYKQDGTSGNYYRDPTSKATDFSGDYVPWQSDYFIVGNYSNSFLQAGDYDVSFVMGDDPDAVQLTKMLNSSTFNAFADDGKVLTPNSYRSLFSNYFFTLVDGKVTLHVRETTD